MGGVRVSPELSPRRATMHGLRRPNRLGAAVLPCTTPRRAITPFAGRKMDLACDGNLAELLVTER